MRAWQMQNNENLIKSGKQLMSLLGCSMKKIRMARATEELCFPNPVKVTGAGKQRIRYYTRTDIDEFMARVNLKKMRLDYNPKPKPIKVPAIITSNTPTKVLYLMFMGVPNSGIDGLQKYGVSRIDLI
jgi:hypothetical protein